MPIIGKFEGFGVKVDSPVFGFGKNPYSIPSEGTNALDRIREKIQKMNDEEGLSNDV
jgi:hypothetical protein